MNAFSGMPESVFLTLILVDVNVSSKARKLVLFLSSFLVGKKVRILGTLHHL